MARFDRTIPPGGEGKITLRIDTGGYEGKIRKTAKVYTNEAQNNVAVLSIKAFVKVPIYLSPRYVYLRGLATQEITKTVKITAGADKPLKLEPSHFDMSETVTYSIEEVEAGRVFKIHFTSIPGTAGTYRGVLRLKTNYPEKPEISIPITGRFQKGGQG